MSAKEPPRYWVDEILEKGDFSPEFKKAARAKEAAQRLGYRIAATKAGLYGIMAQRPEARSWSRARNKIALRFSSVHSGVVS
jgi:hypothetical protein